MFAGSGSGSCCCIQCLYIYLHIYVMQVYMIHIADYIMKFSIYNYNVSKYNVYIYIGPTQYAHTEYIVSYSDIQRGNAYK